LLRTWKLIFEFNNALGISWLSEQLSASQGLASHNQLFSPTSDSSLYFVFLPFSNPFFFYIFCLLFC
jgi:hypothetical protein